MRWGFGRSLGPEGRALVTGSGGLREETPESSLSSPTMWRHSEKRIVYESVSQLSPDTEFVNALILDFPGSGTMRNHV